MKTKIQSIYFLLPVLLIVSSSGSNDKKKHASAPNQVQAYPVVTLTAQSTSLETDYPATIEGIQNVDIRPKVDGFIE